MSFIEAVSQHAFLQNALVAGLLAGVGCGVIGPYVVVKRIAYMAGGIAHAAMGGMGAAYYYELPVLGGALIAAVVAAMLIGGVSLYWREQEDMLIGALWSVGMAVGIMFISQSSGYSVDLMSFLFGNILLVTRGDLWLMAALDGTVLALVVLFYKQFQAVCFDEEFARLRGVAVTRFYLLLLVMVALSVVLLIQVVGLILVIALVTLPAAMAGHWMRSLAAMMVMASLLGIALTGGGLVLAYEPDLPAGATTVLLVGLAYVVSAVSREIRLRRGAR